ncbi:MAG: signal peptidase I [Candidatus Cloacimonetes bacterium HGW-Cloacimonetes-1]|jgi:signal peptidase I|nr:MAG: signal peptidase I [Candidatus Cloacimonetes bacterium HGW-Cloacimonetes-1]
MNEVNAKIQEKNRNSSKDLGYTVTPIPEGTKFRKKKPTVQDWTEALLFAFVVAMIIRNYTFQNFMIPTSSMEKTLLVGDYLVANKLKYYFTDPKREDIVTFRYPKIEEGTPEHPEYKDNFIHLYGPIYINKETSFAKQPLTAIHITYYARKNVVKRVIGMPGDIIEVRNKEVFINGELFKRGYECYGMADPAPPLAPEIIRDYTMLPNSIDYISIHHWYDGYKTDDTANFNRDWFGPVVVPKGKYFVMGDNRDVSEDSRYWGFLERKDITGTPWLIFWSKGIDFNKLYDTPHIRWERVFRFAK